MNGALACSLITTIMNWSARAVLHQFRFDHHRQPAHLRGPVRAIVERAPASPRRSVETPRQRQDHLAGLAVAITGEAELLPHARTHRTPQSLACTRPAYRHRAAGASEPLTQDCP